MLEKTLESPLNFKEIKPVNSEGNQSRIFIGRTDAEAPIIWPLDAKSQLIRKAPDVWESLKAEGKDMTEDEMVGWHHLLNRQTLRDSERQGSLVCCNPWSCRDRHDLVTEQQW